MKMSPCKGCPDRSVSPNCHTACQRYLTYQAERQQIRAAHHADSLVLSALLEGQKKKKMEALKRSKRR